MKTAFIDFCNFHYGSVTHFIHRIAITAAIIIATLTVARIICPVI